MIFKIPHRLTSTVLFRLETTTLKCALEAAVQANANLHGANLCDADLHAANLTSADLCDADLHGANLHGANLGGADLCDADLHGANLHGANLHGANLTGADLHGANLHGANLCDANLCHANLHGANLCDANLCDADFHGANLHGANLCDADLHAANLTGANLTGADLHGANLTGANLCDVDLCDANLYAASLTPIRDDFWAVLCATPAEVPALRLAVVEGRINGSQYSGECACLVGTLANARGCDHTSIPGLTPNALRPSERWFLQLRPGHTPATSAVAALTLEWLDTWRANMHAAFTAPSEIATQEATP